MKAYRKYFIDYLVLTLGQLLWMSLGTLVAMIVYWHFMGIYLGWIHLVFTVWFVFFHYYFTLYPLKKLIPVLKDIRGNRFDSYRGVVKRFTKKKRFSIVSWDRFILSLSLEGSEDEEEFTGFSNDLKEDYLPGDFVEVLAMPTAKVILSVARINGSASAD